LGLSGVNNLIRLILKPVIYILTEKDSPNKFARKKLSIGSKDLKIPLVITNI
jgi:hypothetical protein